MKLNGIGDKIIKSEPDGQTHIDYDALIKIIEQNNPTVRTHVDCDAVRDGYLPAGRFDYDTYRDIWEVIVRERGTDDAWKIIYGLMCIRYGGILSIPHQIEQNSTYRRLNSQRSVFPSGTALLKALYLSTFEATKKWTMPIHSWGKVYGELAIMYDGRLPD